MVISRSPITLVTSAVLILSSQLVSWNGLPFNQTLKEEDFHFLALANAFELQKSIEYKPPNRGAPSSTIAAGSRLVEGSPAEGLRGIYPSCDESLVVSLVPQNHTGQTTSGHPSFFWYLSDKVLPPQTTQKPTMEFVLKQVGKAEPIFKERLPIEKTGIIEMELPLAQAQLISGQDYIWSISIVCSKKAGNNQAQLKTIAIEAGIRRVLPTPELTKQLASVNGESDRARIYAQQGFWYDALEALSKASNAKPEDRSAYEDFYSLLEQVGLDKVAAQARDGGRR